MDDKQYPVIGFGLEYAGQLVFCETVMQEQYYDILFNGDWIGSIIHNDEMEWTQFAGTILPESIIAEIGDRIDSNYK